MGWPQNRNAEILDIVSFWVRLNVGNLVLHYEATIKIRSLTGLNYQKKLASCSIKDVFSFYISLGLFTIKGIQEHA